MKHLLSTLIVLFFSISANAEPLAFVDVKESYHPPSNTIELSFLVKAAENHQLVDEGPWSLTIEGEKLKIDNKSLPYTSKDFDMKIPGFKLKATSEAESGELRYKMRVFVCKDDKSQCFPRLIEGKASWKAKI